MQLIIVIGVSGSGKTTVGRDLAARLGWRFRDADDYHPLAHRVKMQQGVALTDADRWPWLGTLRDAIASWHRTRQPTVLACSALKAAYRQLLCSALPTGTPITWVYLKGDFETISQRLQQRQQSEPEHFMNPDLLKSQFEALEEPQQAIEVCIEQSRAAIVEAIVEAIAEEILRLARSFS